MLVQCSTFANMHMSFAKLVVHFYWDLHLKKWHWKHSLIFIQFWSLCCIMISQKCMSVIIFNTTFCTHHKKRMYCRCDLKEENSLFCTQKWMCCVSSIELNWIIWCFVSICVHSLDLYIIYIANSIGSKAWCLF